MKEDYTFKGGIKITKGADWNGEYLATSFNIGEMKSSITKHYYEEVDNQILINMPDHMLIDLATKCNNEIERRRK